MDDLLRADLERAPEADDAEEAWNTDTFNGETRRS